jgi:hypothetical protein
MSRESGSAQPVPTVAWSNLDANGCLTVTFTCEDLARIVRRGHPRFKRRTVKKWVNAILKWWPMPPIGGDK